MADRPLYVVVLPATVTTEIHTKDTKVPGVYELTADTGMNEQVAAASALETFHDKTPISFPESFLISVIDPVLKKVIEVKETDRAIELRYRKVSSVVQGWLSDLADAGPVPPERRWNQGSHLFVVARAVRPFSELHADDKGVRGVYNISEIDPTMSKKEQAISALATFHEKTPIKLTEDFQIVVIDPLTKQILDTDGNSTFKVFECDIITSGISDEFLQLMGAPTKAEQRKAERKSAARDREEDDPSPQF
jgi:hypothetical protein